MVTEDPAEEAALDSVSRSRFAPSVSVSLSRPIAPNLSRAGLMVTEDPAEEVALDSVSRSRLAFTCSRTWTPLGKIFRSLEVVALKLAPLSRSFFGPPADNPFSPADSAFLVPTNFGSRVLICLIDGIAEDSRSSSCGGELSPATVGERSGSSSSIIALTAPEIAARPKRSEALSAST